VHPPFFYFALKMWSSIFGTSDVAMRFMSIFFGLVAIVFIFHLLKKWFGIKTASIATMVAAISPMLIRYGQEMRMYTMVLAIVFAATYFLSLALENGAKKEGRKYWVIYAILMAVGMWTHYFSAFMWISQLVAIIVFFGGPKKIFKDKKLFKTILYTYIVAVILYLPWIPSFINQAKTVQNGFWIPEMSFEGAADFVSSALFFNKAQEVTSWGLVFGLLLIAVVIIAFVKICAKADNKLKQKLAFIAMMAFGPVLIMALLSLPPLKSTFVDRYVLYSVVTVWILFGLAVSLSKKTWIKNTTMALIIIVATMGISFVEKRTPKGFISEILAETFIAAEEGEPIIADGVYTYYDSMFYSSEKHPIYLFEEGVNYEWGSLEPIRNYRYNVVENSEEFLKNYEKVWYVFGIPDNGEQVKLPEWTEKYRIVSEITLDHHTALEFSR